MKTAVQGELETQKIYTYAPRIKPSSDGLLSKLRAIQSDPNHPEGFELDGDPFGAEVNEDQLAFTLEQTPPTGGSSSEDVLSEEYGSEPDNSDLDTPVADTSEPKEAGNGKKSFREANAAK